MQKSLKLRAIFLLRCPYCLKSPLRKPGSWFEFNDGCPECHYHYEREIGYFLGAPWMINFPSVGIISLVAAVWFFPLVGPKFGMLGLATVISTIAASVAIFFYPFARAIWLVGDHYLHPINEEERTFRSLT